MWTAFGETYLPADPGVQLLSHETTTGEHGSTVTAQLLVDGEHRTVVGHGGGPIAAFVHGIQNELGVQIDVVDYSEHAVSSGSDAQAVAYVESIGPDGETRWGVGMDESILTAGLRALISALNRQR
jgi:2-isopropylmalate synthase